GNAGNMTGGARHHPPACPTAIAIHDDRNMARQAGLLRRRYCFCHTHSCPTSGESSDLHDLLFFAMQGLVDVTDMPVGQLLQFIAELMVFILTNFTVLFRLFQGVHAVAANVADGHAGCIGIFVGELDEFLAALFVQFGQRNADELAVGLRVEAEARVADRLIDRLDQTFVPDLNGDETRFRGTDGSNLVDWRDIAVGLDFHGVEQRSARAAGPQAVEFAFYRGNRTVHATVQFVFIVTHASSSARVAYARSSMMVQRP